MRRAFLAVAAALGLTACAAVAVSLAAAPADSGPQPATLVGAFVWEDGRDGFGGFSGLEVGADGLAFVALSDRAAMVAGRLRRDASGAVAGVEAGSLAPLLDTEGQPLRGGRADSEGLAIGPDGTTWISFEGVARVRREGGGQPPILLPNHPDFAGLPRNGALEALAVDAEGRLYAIPETPRDGGFPVYRFADGAWDLAFAIPASDGFVATGADVGPDGRLYVLERDFAGLGFRSRLRRLNLDGSDEAVLLTTAMGVHDNLEGVSVWRDEAGAHGGGLRATLIADDNFRFLQRTEIVDYRLPE